MKTDTQEHRDHGFVIGLLAGTCVGAGLAMWFAPRSAGELRQRLTESARSLGQLASARYQQASVRAGDAVDDLVTKGRSVRDDLADAVARGAHEVEQAATAARSNRPTEARRHVERPDR